jgi:Sulfotransferase family
VDMIRGMLARASGKAEAVVELAFALHKSLDDLGDYEGAWAALELGCSTKRATLKYRTQDSVHLVDGLMSLPVPGATSPPQGSDAARIPIFIVGMHRSGTTLLEQLLQGHGQVRGLGELYDFTSQMREATDHHCRGVIDREIVRRSGSIDYAAVGRGYLEGLAWRLGAERFFTDKLPSNFMNAGFICRALPQALILHMRRDPMETCFSNLRELFHEANPYSYDQRELGAFHGQYRRLMAHWSRAFPGRILDVDYAQLVAAPEATLRAVTTFCGLSFEPAMLDLARSGRGVSTASAVAVRQGITARDTPKWAPYAKQLQPLAAALPSAG